MRENLNINKINARYFYRPKYNNGEEYQEALKYLGHVTAEKIEMPTNDEFDKSMKILLSKLNELEITISSRK